MKHKNNRVSAEDLDEVIASHFGNFDTVEADEDEDFEGDDEEMLEDEEDILDDAEGDEIDDEDGEDLEDDEDEIDEDEDVTDEDEDSEDSEDDEDFEDEGDSEDEDSEEDDEADADDEFDGEGDDEEEDFLDVDGEDEDDSEDDEDFDAEDDEDFDAEADEDEDFEDIDAVIASAEDPIEALIACGAVAVIMPTAPHDFQEVKAAFDGLDDSEDEDFEADADEDFEADADEDESCDDDEEVLEDDEDEIDEDEVDASDDEDDEDFEADASDDEDSDEEDDEVTADEDEETDSENFHPVADMEMLAEASAEDVELVLYAQGSDAWWNVIVAGLPAARISKESLSPEVHAFFVQDQFASNVKETIASEGLLPVLENMHAEFYATAFLNSELAEEIRSEVEATASEDVTERAANLREDFLKAVNLASAGCNKNYWPKLGSPLKAALFEELAEAGVSNAAEIIENAFAKGGDAHFEAVTSKAVEIMDKSPEYREELEEAIAEAGVISHASDESDDEEIEESSNTATASFMQKLVQGSFGNKSSKGSLGDRLRNGLGR